MLKLVWYCVALLIQATCCGSSIAEGVAATSAIPAPKVNFSVVIASERSGNDYLKGFVVQYNAGDELTLGSFIISDALPSVVPTSVPPPKKVPLLHELRIKNYAIVYYVEGVGSQFYRMFELSKKLRDRNVIPTNLGIVSGYTNSPNGKHVALAVRDRYSNEDSIIIFDERSSQVVTKMPLDQRMMLEDICWSQDSSTVAAVVSKSRTGISPIALLLAISGHPVTYKDFSVGVLSVDTGKWTESEPFVRDVDAVSYMRCNGFVEHSSDGL